MSFFRKLGDNISKFAKTAFEGTKKVTKSAVESTKDFAEITKLKGKIGDENKKITQAYSQIGELLYTKYRNLAGGELAELCTGIDAAKEAIEQLKTEIESVKEPKASEENTASVQAQEPEPEPEPEHTEINEDCKDENCTNNPEQ